MPDEARKAAKRAKAAAAPVAVDPPLEVIDGAAGAPAPSGVVIEDGASRSSDQVAMRLGAVGRVEAGQLTVGQGAVGAARAGTMTVEQGAVGAVLADRAEISRG